MGMTRRNIKTIREGINEAIEYLIYQDQGQAAHLLEGWRDKNYPEPAPKPVTHTWERSYWTRDENGNNIDRKCLVCGLAEVYQEFEGKAVNTWVTAEGVVTKRHGGTMPKCEVPANG